MCGSLQQNESISVIVPIKCPNIFCDLPLGIGVFQQALLLRANRAFTDAYGSECNPPPPPQTLLNTLTHTSRDFYLHKDQSLSLCWRVKRKDFHLSRCALIGAVEPQLICLLSTSCWTPPSPPLTRTQAPRGRFDYVSLSCGLACSPCG